MRRKNTSEQPHISGIKLNLSQVPELFKDIKYIPSKNEYLALNLTVYQRIIDIPLSSGETILSGGHVTPLVALGLCSIRDIRFVSVDEDQPEKVTVALVISSGDLIRRTGSNAEKVKTVFSNFVSELGQVLTKIEYVAQLTAIYTNATQLPERFLALRTENTARIKTQYPIISSFFDAKRRIILRESGNPTLQALLQYEETIARIYSINKAPNQRFTPGQLKAIK